MLLMFLKQEVERLKNIEETTRRDYRNISENGAEIRRRPGRRDTESNAEIEDTITLFDRGLLSVREFLLTIAARTDESIVEEHRISEAVGKEKK